YILLFLNQSYTEYFPVANSKEITLPADFRFDPAKCEQGANGPKREHARGPLAATDSSTYFVCHQTDTSIGTVGRYLANDQGIPVYLTDPGINGVFNKTADGGTRTIFNAPKATLMSYIIKGILSQQLPWGLVLLGVFIAIVLELAGIPSLAFAVGVYLPISTSAPIFVGGLVRLGVDKYLRGKFASKNLSEEELMAETDKSPGVLLASGYIAGGALAGVVHAFLNFSDTIHNKLNDFEKWSTTKNGFFAGPNSDYLALIPLAILTTILYLVGRELILKPKPFVTRE
ncbi:MAG TPA: OPT/YSL family transporter, partial [Pyrinomonadaceae bacterium]|nr:OPT/YSL family transporter [Pyrinomonadaceae bacterium]